MSDVLDGDEWKTKSQPTDVVVNLTPRTRAEQQAWVDEEYGKGRITRDQWRFQFDILSFQNTDGSFPPDE